MNKNTVLIGTAGFLLGIGCGFLFAPKDRNIGLTQLALSDFTSQGRSEIQKMAEEINGVLDEDVGEIMAEKTRMLQAISAKEPDQNAADFYLSGMEDKMNKAHAKINRILLNTIQRMPFIDRRTYMKLYLKKRPVLKLHSVVLPPLTETNFDDFHGETNLILKSRTTDPS